MAKNLTQLRTAIGNWLNVSTGRLSNAVRDDIINIVMRELLRFHELRFGETSNTFATVASTRDYALPRGWSKPYSLWYIHPTNNGIVWVEYLAKDKFDNLFPDSTKEALPINYTVWGGNIQLGKTPDQAVTINRNYYQILSDLAEYVASTISFANADSSINDTASGLPLLNVGETITVSGTANNDGTYTVVSSTAAKIVVEEAITTEAAGTSFTVANYSNDFTDEAWEVILFKALLESSRYGIEDARIPMWEKRADKLERDLVTEHARARTTGRKSVSREP